MTTRKEHLDWAKNRAYEYLDRGDIDGAYGSFTSDLNKHGETRDHAAIEMGLLLKLSGNLNTATEMKKFIEGFN